MIKFAPYQQVRRVVRIFLLRTLPSCKDTVPVISQSMERPLRLGERFRLRLHLWVCKWCQRYLEQLQMLRTALRLSADRDESDSGPSPQLSPDARERIRRKLAEDS